MAVSWGALAMVFFPSATVGGGKSSHLQLVAPMLPPIVTAGASDQTAGGSDFETPARVVKHVPVRDFIVTREQAAREFLTEWICDLVGGGEWTFRTIATSYDDLRAIRGWPEMKDKALSENLQALGCVTWTANRQPGGKRPTIIRIPDDLTDRPRRRKRRRKA